MNLNFIWGLYYHYYYYWFGTERFSEESTAFFCRLEIQFILYYVLLCIHPLKGIMFPLWPKLHFPSSSSSSPNEKTREARSFSVSFQWSYETFWHVALCTFYVHTTEGSFEVEKVQSKESLSSWQINRMVMVVVVVSGVLRRRALTNVQVFVQQAFFFFLSVKKLCVHKYGMKLRVYCYWRRKWLEVVVVLYRIQLGEAVSSCG